MRLGLATCALCLALTAPCSRLRAEPGQTPAGTATQSLDRVVPGPALVRRGIFDRPYLTRAGSLVAIGGYIDLLGGYRREDGISDGFSFEARRFNVFLSSAIADFIRLTSELEFEHGTEEIALETALVDLLFHHAFNVRGGILLVPLGRFNVAHDSPIYDVIDRPLVSTRIIPATLSEIGFGVFGILYPGAHRLTYELYLVNGLGDGVLAEEGTRISSGKSGAFFEKDNNGRPALTGRLGYGSPWGLELGLSFYSATYNRFEADGETIDNDRSVTIFALDGEYQRGRWTLRGECAVALINVPDSLEPEFATEQFGFYAEVVLLLLKRSLLVFEEAALYGVSRLDYVDLNVSSKQPTGQRIGDETARWTLGLSFRPSPSTSFRVSYYHEWLTDALTNSVRAGAVQFGLASYF